MRVTAAHHGTAILENLHGPHPRLASQLLELFTPSVYDSPNFSDAHPCERKIVPGREADHPALSGLALRPQQFAVLKFSVGEVGAQGGIIIVENKGPLIDRVSHSARPYISRAKITIRIVPRQLLRWRRLHLPLPRTFGAMRRDQYPFFPQRIKPPVWLAL